MSQQQAPLTSSIECPNCGHTIDVDKVLSEQTETKLRQEYEQKYLEKEKTLKDQQEKLKKERESIDQKVDEEMKKKLKDLEKKMRKDIIDEKEKEYNSQIKQMQEELDEKSKAIKELNELKAEKSRLVREKEEMESKFSHQYEEKLNEMKKELSKTSKKEAEDKYERQVEQLKESQKHLQDQLKEAQKKAEQGSMRDQGEAQEIALENHLKEQFPQDEIEPVKTGARGADILHTVMSRSGMTCGTILYESKNAANFQENWISKLKDDQLKAQADIAILVSDVKPNGVEGIREYKGVWLCSYMEFKDLCHLMRNNLTQLGEKLASYENRNDKIALLYNYLTSEDFKVRTQNLVQNYTDMKEDLRKERQYMERAFAKRETALNNFISNTEGMFGSIQAIAGGEDIPLPALENVEDAEDGKALGSGEDA